MSGSISRAFGNAGWFLGSRGVTGILSLFYLAIAVRTLGLADFGRFALVQSLAQAVTGLVTFQTWQIVIRYGMPALEAGDARGLDDVIGFSARLDAASALAGTILSIVAVLLLAPLFGWSGDLQWQACLFSAAMLLALRSTPIGILRLKDRFAVAGMGDTVTPVVRLIGAGLAALFSAHIVGFLIAWAAAEIATSAVFWLLALKQHRVVWRGGAFRRMVAAHPDIWRFTWFTNAASSLTLTARQVTLLIVGGMGGAAAAGAFRIAAQIAQAIAKLTLALSRSVFPELVRGAATDADYHRLIARMTRIAAIGGAGALVITAAIGRPLLDFLTGTDMAHVYWPMLLLTAAAAIDLGGVTLEPALAARGRSGTVLMLRAVATGLQVVLLLLLLPPLGALGAGWASIAGSLAALLLAWAAVRRTAGPLAPSIAAEAPPRQAGLHPPPPRSAG